MGLGRLLRRLGAAGAAVVTVAVSSPVQGVLLVANYLLLRAALRAARRARFAASVRLLRDVTSEDDLRALLGRLPPWVRHPDWERGDAVQCMLGLLWPAINSTVCALLRRELEERVQASSDFGHISFSRLSFGRHPPVIAGIKAVPLYGEDLLAMVLDVEIRWAGEPDVCLHLTKLGGASLGLSDVHLAGVVRLVFSPITEDPPFLRRLAISLLNRPYVDFSVRALGGPDLMALPAISSWLHGAVLNAAERAIVWPKEVSVPLGPPPAAEAALAAAAEAAALIPPLGVLVVRVVRADIEPRRSTFLGRLKLPSPRVALVLPETPAGAGGGGADEGVMQAGLTPAREKTLQPQWDAQFQFVVSRPSQEIRLLLTHRRLDLLAADMPLGAADLPVEDILAEYAAARAAEAPRSGPAPVRTGREAPPLRKAATDPPPRRRRGQARDETPSPRLHTATTFTAGSGSGASVGDEGYASASSTPRLSSRSASPAPSFGGGGGGGGSVVWASPATGLPATPDGGGAPAAVRTRSGGAGGAQALAWTASLAQSAALGPNGTLDVEATAALAVAAVAAQGLGLLLPETSGGGGGGGRATPAPQWTPLASRPPPADAEAQGEGAAPAKHAQQPRRTARASPAPAPRGSAATAGTWLSPGGVWVEVPASRSMTMGGMVSNAAEAEVPQPQSAGGPRAAAAAAADDDAAASGGWLRSMRSMMMRAANLAAPEEEEEEEEEEGGGGDEERPPAESCAGKVKLALSWLPVASGPSLLGGTPAASPLAPADGAGAGEAAPVASPRPAPSLGDARAGVLAVRVAYTKLDYGDSPVSPILSLSIGLNPAASMSAVAAAAAAASAPAHRMVCTECQAGGRPGLLHWGRVFHLPVWSPGASRALLELGDAASALKLSSYGAELYALDACADFESDVNVEAAASIPLKDVLAKGVVRGTWRLREARRGAAGGLAAASEAAHEHLDIGRVALVMAWFPLE